MRTVLYMVLLCFSSSLFAQNYIYSSKSKKPIQYANIFYGENKGLISNEDGYFELPDDINKNQEINISHVSYKSTTINLATLKKGDTIYLDESPIELDEVVLERFNVKDTLKKAIQKVDENYLVQAHNLYGFFRQSLQENNSGVEMIEVDFISYLKDKNAKYTAKIQDARRSKNYSELGLETYGGVFQVIENGDFVKRKANFLNTKEMNNYKYSFGGTIDYDSYEVYVFDFKPSPASAPKYLRRGRMYVETESLAIVEINYGFDERRLEASTIESENYRNTYKAIYRLMKVDNTIKYKRLTNGKWGLSFIEARNTRKGMFGDKDFMYKLNAKLVINQISTENVKAVRTNYNISKNFASAVKRFDNNKWDDNYKFSLSKKEQQIIADINSKKK